MAGMAPHTAWYRLRPGAQQALLLGLNCLRYICVRCRRLTPAVSLKRTGKRMGLEKSIDEQVAELYRTESRRVLATLIRLLGDFDLAEEALQEAFRAALEQWPREGLPRNPRAWLVSTGRFKGIDVVRRRGRHEALLATVAQETREAY